MQHVEDIDVNQVSPGFNPATATKFTKFNAPLNVVYDPKASRALGKSFYRVLEPFKYYVGALSEGTWVYVPEGFLTDGASVPEIFQWIIPAWGNHGQAAVVHDVLCVELAVWKDGVAHAVDRREADRIFLEAMKVAGSSFLKRWTMFLVLRAYSLLGFKTDQAFLDRRKAIEAEYNPADFALY